MPQQYFVSTAVPHSSRFLQLYYSSLFLYRHAVPLCSHIVPHSSMFLHCAPYVPTALYLHSKCASRLYISTAMPPKPFVPTAVSLGTMLLRLCSMALRSYRYAPYVPTTVPHSSVSTAVCFHPQLQPIALCFHRCAPWLYAPTAVLQLYVPTATPHSFMFPQLCLTAFIFLQLCPSALCFHSWTP